MRPSVQERIVPQLERHEGVKLSSYLCPAGRVTIGVGHNLEARPVPGIPCEVGHTITADQARRLLIRDLVDCDRALNDALPWVSSLDDARYGVLLNMAFNLGVHGLRGFRRMLAAVRGGRYDDAAAEMINSVWARQVKGRARELAQQMRTGEWV